MIREKSIYERLIADHPLLRTAIKDANNPEEDFIAWKAGDVLTVYNKDARDLSIISNNSVQLVVTSPPYNVGTKYNSHDDTMDLNEYLSFLDTVWKECKRVLVPGGRICVNVPAGTGRSPYIPISDHVMAGLGKHFSLRGVIVWDKGTSGGRTTWGSYRLPTNPTLRDTTERIIVANEGEPGQGMEIPVDVKRKDGKGVYSPFLENGDLFRELTQDHWQVCPESKARVRHPAPFPVAIPERLIRLYAYPGALIMDPFAGSGTTAIASLRLGCKCILIDTDYDYCQLALRRYYNGL